MDVPTLIHLESTPNPLPPFLYASISYGADTRSSTLGKGRQIFSFDSQLRSEESLHRTNYYRENWSKYPNLDLLLVHDTKMNKSHDQWVKDWGYLSRAKHTLVVHGKQALKAYKGKGFKSWSKIIMGRGYNTHA